MAQRDYLFPEAKKSGDLEAMNSYVQLGNRVKQFLKYFKLR